MAERKFNDHEQVDWLEKAAIRLSNHWGIDIAPVAVCLQKSLKEDVLSNNRIYSQPKLVAPTDANAFFFPDSYQNDNRRVTLR